MVQVILIVLSLYHRIADLSPRCENPSDYLGIYLRQFPEIRPRRLCKRFLRGGDVLAQFLVCILPFYQSLLSYSLPDKNVNRYYCLADATGIMLY